VGDVSLPIARVLGRALEGRELDRDGGLLLGESGPEAIGPLTAVADEVRRDRVGDIVTYVVNRNINSGTLMEENISRSAGASEAECLAPGEIRERIREAGRIPAERSTTYRLLKIFSASGSRNRSRAA